jgi:hypothetical protein
MNSVSTTTARRRTALVLLLTIVSHSGVRAGKPGSGVCTTLPTWTPVAQLNGPNDATPDYPRMGLSLAADRVALRHYSDYCETSAVVVATGPAADTAAAMIEVFFLDEGSGQILDGQASGCGQPHVSLPIPLTATGERNAVWTIRFGNLDGNDVPDFVATSRPSESAWAYLGWRDSSGEVRFGADPTGWPITIAEPTGSTARFGYASAFGDVDGDGHDEVAIGAAPGTKAGQPGRIFVYSLDTAGDGLSLRATLTSPSGDSFNQFGLSVDVADVTGDGTLDVVTQALMQDVGKVRDAGVAFVYAGAPGTTSTTTNLGLSATPITLTAEAPVDEAYGYRVRAADVGGADAAAGFFRDSRADVIATTGWSGPDTRLDITLGPVSNGSTPATQLSLRPEAELDGGWGTGEPVAADVNGDGRLDVFIGAMNASRSSACNSPGVAYAYLTQPGDTMIRHRLEAPTADVDFAGYGRWVVAVDGTPLVLVSEQGRNFGASPAGQVYVYLAPRP